MSNNYSSSIAVNTLQTRGALNPQQGVFPPVRTMARIYLPDPDIRLATNEVKYVTVGSTTQTNPATYQTNADATITPIQVAVSRYTTSFQVASKDLAGGLRLLDLLAINMKIHQAKLAQVLTTLLTAANFPASGTPALTVAAGLFNLGNLAALRTPLNKSDQKFLILHPDWYSGICHTPGFNQIAGWAGILEYSDWSAAEAKTVGFACSPSAMAVVNGPPDNPSPIIDQVNFTLPDLGIECGLTTWYEVNARTYWSSFDNIFGAALADTSAGVLLKSP
jgi:hypothetical protein